MAKKKATTKDPGPSEADLAHILPALRPLATPLDQLLADPRNARRHPERNLAATQASLARFGQRKNVVARRQPDGTLLLEAGHGTCAAARALGWRFVAAVVLEESEPEARAYGLADNRTAELAEWDQAVLFAEHAAGMDLEALGWEPDELTVLGAVAEAEFPEIPSGDRPDYRQQTFSLHKDQDELVRRAVEAAAQQSPGSALNTNRNGNAITFICAAFLGEAAP